MYLRAHGDCVVPIEETSVDLKDWVVDAVGQPVRRISRFIQLALIGAGRCARGMTLPANTAVYLASSRGDLELTMEVMNLVYREGHAPKPLSFVNTVSNSAAFYIAKCLGLQARSAFACSRYFAFENALQLALVDFELGLVDSALVGCVESAVQSAHIDRDDAELDGAPITAEASHWLWFTRQRGEESLGKVRAVQSTVDQAELMKWIDAQAVNRSDCWLSQGQYVRPQDLSSIQARTPLERIFEYRDRDIHHSSESGAVIASFAHTGEIGHSLLHINSDPLGRYVAMLVDR